jgi:hypothetical protein
MSRGKGGSDAEVIEDGLHLAGGVGVVGAVGGFEAGSEAGAGFFGAAELDEGLGGHLIGGDVVGVVADQDDVLGEGRVGAPVAGVLHGEAVAREGVGGVELEDFIEGCDLVHVCMVGGGSWGWQVGRRLNRGPRFGEG